MRHWSVGIVGGGPGGLMTAYCLQKYAAVPYRATIFEASPRLGGKIVTGWFQSTGARYEAGAAELYDYSPVDEDGLRELVEELGLSITPMRGSAVIMSDRVLSNLEDVARHLGPGACAAVRAFDRRAKDQISPREFYHSDECVGAEAAPDTFAAALERVPDPRARAYIRNMIHSDVAAEPEQTSLSYGLHNYLMNDPAYMQLYSIEGGNERLPRELAARSRATKLLGHAVTSVGTASDGRLAVTSAHAGAERRDAFDFLALALPNSHLPRLAFRGERLAAAMRDHCAHYDHPAHYLRVTVLFRRNFWREALTDSYWMLDKFGGCCLYDESSREPESPHGVLGWLLGGDAARDMSSWSDERLVEAALDSLPALLAHGRALVAEAHVHRWIGSVSALPGGRVKRSLDRRHRPEPVGHPNLFVVGDYLFDSTLNGVLDSAEYVAESVAARMAEFSGARA
ncbi:MAG: flavin monoamine oxidase family protein [Gemmata sp.]